jgi:hypothetical protein
MSVHYRYLLAVANQSCRATDVYKKKKYHIFPLTAFLGNKFLLNGFLHSMNCNRENNQLYFWIFCLSLTAEDAVSGKL